MISRFVKPPLRLVKRAIYAAPTAVRRRRSLSLLKGATRLHIGSGADKIPGWANIDYDTAGAAHWDLRCPLPIHDRSIDYIYSQHFIEHITRAEGVSHLRDCHRLLRPGGVIRISTPNLRYISETYLAGNVAEWLTDSAFWNPRTPAQMLNDALRLWGHQFVYDHDELRAVLSEAGFTKIAKQARGESQHQPLRGLETRPDHQDVTVEAER